MSGFRDPRNLATAALYLALAWLGLAARPWRVLAEWAGRSHAVSALGVGGRVGDAGFWAVAPSCNPPTAPALLHGLLLQAAPTPAEQSRRWRLAVAAGLLVGPFFPASNVLFYVGTFIGERLLYFPSGSARQRCLRAYVRAAGGCLVVRTVHLRAGRHTRGPVDRTGRWCATSLAAPCKGCCPKPTAPAPALPCIPPGSPPLPASAVGYCILLAQPLASALQPLLPQPADTPPGGAADGAPGASATTAAPQPPRRLRRVRAALAAALLAALLAFYAGRTVLRNRDWLDEERLFLAAQKVCGAVR